MLVIFDCDGVLVDSETLSARVLSDCLRAEGFDASAHQVIETYRGKSVPDCVVIVTRELSTLAHWQGLSPEQQNQKGAAFWRDMQLKTLEACKRELTAIEGVEAVLSGLQARGINFCVASNGKHEKMAVTLVKTGLMSYFAGHIFSFEDVVRGKPAPDLFLYAAKTMGAAPAQTLVIEDSLTGLEAALAAGMKPFAYCPPEADGSENLLLPQVRAMGVTHFETMAELLALVDQAFNP